MRPYLWLPFLCLALTGCLANQSLGSDSIAQTNVYNLSKISLGMSESEVRKIMRRPYSQQIFVVGQDLYDVWFYVTRVTALGQSEMVNQNLTPLTFKNEILVGTGYDYYRWLIQQENEERKNLKPAPPAPPKKEEDTDLEKALDTPKSPPSPKNSQPLSMGSCTKKPKNLEGTTPEEDPSNEDLPFKKEDEEMIEQESEQNFNYW